MSRNAPPPSSLERKLRLNLGPNRRFALVLLCFFLSGFAALLYETVWTRQFAFVFGTSELAVATVLASYMGGLAGGAALGGRLASRLRRPVLAYGILELAIAVSALLVPAGIALAMRLARLLFGGGEEPPEAAGLSLSLFYLGCSFLILLPATFFMGATLPVLARSAVTRDAELGPRIGILYAANTMGAVAGTLTAAFGLLPALGLRASVLTGVAINVAVFAAAALGLREGPSEEPPPAPAVRAPPWTLRSLVLPLMLLSGAASFTYEVLWTRLLGHILGGSVYAFATMLATFLAGIAAGGAAGSGLAARPARALARLAVAQLAIGILSWLAFLGVNGLPRLALKLEAGASGGLIANALLCALVLFPAAFAIGATYPLAVRALALGPGEAALASARVYAWNTVGAIAGSVAAGFWLIPRAGYEGALALAAGLNLVLGAACALLSEPRAPRLALAAAAMVAALALLRPGTPWLVLGFRPLSPGHFETRPFERDEVAYLGVGSSGTVLVQEENLQWELRVNGNPEAGIGAPGYFTIARSAEWLTGLPVLARPGARTMMVIGLGGGTLLEALPRSLESVHVLELEPEVLAANRLLGPRRARDPLADPRVRVFLNDGRGALFLTRARYDAIVSQPSHPWTAGASHLYTREFFELAREHLTPDGVFLQWIGAKFVDLQLLRSLAATLTAVFPHVRAYRPQNGPSLLFLGSAAPLPVEETAARALAASGEEFRLRGVQRPEDVAAALALDEEAARAFAAGGAVNTDDDNLLQARSPGLVRSEANLEKLDRLDAVLAPYDPLVRLRRPEWDEIYLHRMLRFTGQAERAERFLATGADPVRGALLRGMLLAAANQWEKAVESYREALRLRNDSGEAKALLARALASRPTAPNVTELNGLFPSLGEGEGAAVRGLFLLEPKDADGLQALDPALAKLPPGHLLFDVAARLRAVWRLRAGGEAPAREAIRILEAALPFSRTPFSSFPPDALLRSELYLAAGQPDAALGILLEAVETFGSKDDAYRKRFLEEAENLLARIPAAPGRLQRREEVAAALRKKRDLKSRRRRSRRRPCRARPRERLYAGAGPV